MLVEQAGKFVHVKLEADLSKADVVEGEHVWCEDSIYETPIIPMAETECIFAVSQVRDARSPPNAAQENVAGGSLVMSTKGGTANPPIC